MLVLAILCALQVAARAEPTVATASEHYQKARAARSQGDYPRALQRADEGLKAQPEHLELLRLRAEMLEETGRCEPAIEAYRRYLAAGPSRGNARQVRQMLSDLEICRSTRLVISVESEATALYLRSKSFGVICVATPDKPCDLGLIPGRHRILAERRGFHPFSERVLVEKGQTLAHELVLKERPSRLQVAVTPAARIELDGAAVVASGSGYEDPALAPGEHALRLSAPGCFAAHDQTVTAARGTPVRVEVALREQLAVTVVEQNRAGQDGPGSALEAARVELSLDGASVELVDGQLVLPSVAGAVTLGVRARGYRSRTVEIPAERPEDCALTVALEAIPRPPAVIEALPDSRPDGARGGNDWTWWKTGALATSGALVVASGVHAAQQSLASRRDIDRAEPHCTRGEGPGWSCDEQGTQLLARARRATDRANLALAATAVSTVGLIGAWSWLEKRDDTRDGLSTRRKIALGATGGIAAASLGTAVFHGLRSRSRRNEASADCTDDMVCGPSGYASSTLAASDARVANSFFITASVATAGTALLWWTGRGGGEDGSRPSVSISLDSGSAGLVVAGAF